VGLLVTVDLLLLGLIELYDLGVQENEEVPQMELVMRYLLEHLLQVQRELGDHREQLSGESRLELPFIDGVCLPNQLLEFIFETSQDHLAVFIQS